MKFVLDKTVSPQAASFYNKDQALGNALAAKLLEIPGVSNVMLLGDFVTVGKQGTARWSEINGPVKKVLASAE